VAPTTTTIVPPTPTPCEGYARLVTGTLAEGASQVQPGGWYYFARSGFHAACLDAPDGVNFDVTLQRFAGMRWVDVASASGSGGDETVTFNGRYGIYRYLVTAVSGSGAYTLGFKRP
jgi:streptogrisin C